MMKEIKKLFKKFHKFMKSGRISKVCNKFAGDEK